MGWNRAKTDHFRGNTKNSVKSRLHSSLFLAQIYIYFGTVSKNVFLQKSDKKCHFCLICLSFFGTNIYIPVTFPEHTQAIFILAKICHRSVKKATFGLLFVFFWHKYTSNIISGVCRKFFLPEFRSRNFFGIRKKGRNFFSNSGNFWIFKKQQKIYKIDSNRLKLSKNLQILKFRLRNSGPFFRNSGIQNSEFGNKFHTPMWGFYIQYFIKLYFYILLSIISIIL